MKVRAMVLTAGLLVGTAALACAQTNTDLNNEATRMNSLASSQGDGKVIGKISGDFNSFLGSDANAVVTGLRNGTPINLTRTTTTTSSTPGGAPITTTTTTTITPPTGQMGHGNVYISLALAKYQLSTMGITEPTPQQLQAALTGGTITQTTATGTTTTTMQGILTMRSEKMGWGKIAQELGTKLGPVISGMRRANYQLANAATTSSKQSGVTGASGQSSGSSKSGIVSGSGKSHGNSDQGMSSAKGSGSGIVTASGRSGGYAYGRSGGMVSGAGHGGGSAGGAASGAGNGAAHGKGSGK